MYLYEIVITEVMYNSTAYSHYACHYYLYFLYMPCNYKFWTTVVHMNKTTYWHGISSWKQLVFFTIIVTGVQLLSTSTQVLESTIWNRSKCNILVLRHPIPNKLNWRFGCFTSYWLLTIPKRKTHLNCIFMLNYIYFKLFFLIYSLSGFYWNSHMYEFFLKGHLWR